MKTTYHQTIGDVRPRRGDLLQSNIGDRRERTWIVISSRVLPTRWCREMNMTAQRTKVWAERWWDLEPGTRLALYNSAVRSGGQAVHPLFRFRAAKKPSFEQHMRGASQ